MVRFLVVVLVNSWLLKGWDVRAKGKDWEWRECVRRGGRVGKRSWAGRDDK